jgi:hypothetical protein
MMLLLWSLASYLELQRSMRWWFQRRSAELEAQSERIHNGIMQEVFVLRRELEATLERGQSIAPRQHQSQLQAIERIHHQLEQISDELAPPYLADSFPLAIQSYLKDWQRLHSDHDLKMELPSSWEYESTELSPVLLTALNELLELTVLTSPVTLSCHVRLIAPNPQINAGTQPNTTGALAVEIIYPDQAVIATILRKRELRYLRRVMRGLAGGRLSYRRRDQTVTWYFHWPLRSASSLTVGVD